MGRALSTSLWADTAPAVAPRPPLRGHVDADVAVVGAGFTGLWTAYYLARARPDLRVVVLEAQTAGFGASGRNGGWCSALFPAGPATLARWAGREAAVAQHAAMRATVDEVGRVLGTEGIDAHWAKGGSVSLARSPAQLARAREEVVAARRWGRGPDDLRLLGAQEATAMVGATRVLGGTFTPDCAAVHPLRLVRGLADVVTAAGVTLHEHSPVQEIVPGRVTTDHGSVTAGTVVRATEGFTATLPGHRRTVVPVYSLVIATEPLPDELWERIGLAGRPTFADHRHLVIYGQRTADGRLVFGGRGAPYHFGSRVRPAYDTEERVFDRLRETLVDLFPALADVRITHRWGGPLGIPRDWCASVGLDPATRLAWAGGYVGDGVATSNLAGRTLRDLVLGEDTALTRLPWVGHRSRDWEPEPLRWLGINAGLRATALADAEEQRTGRPSVVGRLVHRLLG
ncbi:NAD(P)/FAD-dependent oxidoreductase [Nocardioides sp. GCM10027113]|uniref:NAD(P)/FAD-dependent oxidoreductase n=1 Tax=unclassified Nocardioides TaxID=2615069 RepID=UPI003605B2CF